MRATREPDPPHRPPRRSGAPPDPPPLTRLIIALTELVEVGRDCLQAVLDEFERERE